MPLGVDYPTDRLKSLGMSLVTSPALVQIALGLFVGSIITGEHRLGYGLLLAVSTLLYAVADWVVYQAEQAKKEYLQSDSDRDVY